MIEAVFINLDDALGRRAAMETQLAKIRPPYPVARLAGINGRQQANLPRNLSAGEYGCWLSHLSALGQSMTTGKHLHVMEDDVLLSEALRIVPDTVGALDADSGGDWDILYLDAILVEMADMYLMFEWTQLARKNSAVEVCKLPPEFTVYGTMSYIVNSRRKKYLYDYLSSHIGAGKPIDNVLACGIQRQHLKAYVTAPFVTSGTDETLASTIGREAGKGDIAWLLFRRLCFCDLGKDAIAALERKAIDLTATVPTLEAVFGALCAYRVSQWPNARFFPNRESD